MKTRAFRLMIVFALVGTEPTASQVFPPPQPNGNVFGMTGQLQPVASKQSWTKDDHDGAVAALIAAAAALPAEIRDARRFRAAQLLGKMGDQTQAAQVLRDAAEDPHRLNSPLDGLARELVSIGDDDDASRLFARVKIPGQQQQVVNGMLQAAIAGNKLSFALATLQQGRALLAPGQFDPFQVQERALAEAFAKSGAWTQALDAVPKSSNPNDPVLPRIAREACRADPKVSGDTAAHILREALLQHANDAFSPPFVQAFNAYRDCQGQQAAQDFLELLPPDYAAGLRGDTIGNSAVGTIDGPHAAALAATTALRRGDAAEADRKFGEAIRLLNDELARRGRTANIRFQTDRTAGDVALSLFEAHRKSDALSLVDKLTVVERVPVLFRLAEASVRDIGDSDDAVLSAIDSIFIKTPELISTNANAIRSLRNSILLRSPISPRIESWVAKLPNSPSGPPPVSVPFGGSNPMGMFNNTMAALEHAAPSTRRIRYIIEQAQQKHAASAVIAARSFKLTPRETAVRDLFSDFITRLPEELLLGMNAIPQIAELTPGGLKTVLAAEPRDQLLFAVESIALANADLDSAKGAAAAVRPGSPMAPMASAAIAAGEAKAGLPIDARADASSIVDPIQGFAASLAIASVLPTP